MRTFYFSIPDVMCYACVSTIEQAIEQHVKTYRNTPQWQLPRVLLGQKCIEVSLTEDAPCLQTPPESLPDVLTIALNDILEPLGFPCTWRSAQDEPAQLKKEVSRSAQYHATIGFIAVLCGLAVMLVMLFVVPAPGGIFLMTMGIISLCATLGLGAPFYFHAWKELKRGQPGMDVLFALSTLTVVIVSILSFFMPGLPLLFEAGLLVFGFRHLGLALKDWLFKTAGVADTLQDEIQKKVLKYTPAQREEWSEVPLASLQPGDLVMIESGGVVPLDGEWVSWPGHHCSQGTDKKARSLITTAIDGATVPQSMQEGALLFAGMRLQQQEAPLCLRLSGVPYYTLVLQNTAPNQRHKTRSHHSLSTQQTLVVYPQADHIYAALGTQKPVELDDCLSAALKTLLLQPQICWHDLSLEYQTELYTALAQKGYPREKTTSYLAELEQAMRHAHAKKASLDQTVQRFIAHYFIPTILGVALIAGCTLGILVSPSAALLCVINILVAACPCTIGLIVPFTLAVGRDKARGITLLQEQCLPALSEVTHAFIDLNGTLTQGTPQVDLNRSVMTEEGWRLLFSLEATTVHPIGEAIRQAAMEQANIKMRQHFTTLEHKPAGVKGTLDGVTYCVGDEQTLQQEGLEEALRDYLTPVETAEGVVIYLAMQSEHGQTIIGHVMVTDPLRPGAKALVAGLQARGIGVELLTGASPAVANAFAKQLEIQTVHAGIRRDAALHRAGQPTGKEAVVVAAQKAGKRVLMIGDALNDVDAFVAAEASLLMQHGPRLPALEEVASAMLSQEGDVLWLLDVSRQTMQHIHITLGLTLLYNLAVVLFAAGIFTSLGVTLTPGISAAFMCVPLFFLLCSLSLLKCRPMPDANLHHPSERLSFFEADVHHPENRTGIVPCFDPMQEPFSSSMSAR